MKNFAITTIASAAIMLATAMTMQAQEQETKFSIKPTGRMLLDGAVYARRRRLLRRGRDARYPHGGKSQLREMGCKNRRGLRLRQNQHEGRLYAVQLQPLQSAPHGLLRAPVRPQRRHFKLDETGNGSPYNRYVLQRHRP